MEVASPSSITLVVKAPNQRVRDIEVSCLLDWTVEKLKSHLANVYPTKPARSSQKIIYSGKLLDDHFLLKDILQESEGQQQTVHLVCTPSPLDAFKTPTSAPAARDPPATQTTVPEVSAPTTSSSQPDGLTHRHHHAHPQHPFYNMYPGNPAAFPANVGQVDANNPNVGHFAPGQLYFHQDAHHFGQHIAHYAAQHAAQHMAHMQWMHHMAQMMQGLPYVPMQPPVPYPQQTVPQQQTPQANPPAPAAPQAPQAQERRENRPQNRNIVMNANAGGGMMQQDEDADEEENVRRDWLDYIYMAVRIFMLMSIFWFYSSAERLVLMAVALIVIWIVQSGWFNLNRAQRNRQQDPPANVDNNQEPAQGEEVQGDDGDGEDEEEDGSETDSQSGADTDEADVNNTTSNNNDTAQPQHPGYLVVCYNFLTTFFTSLIPQGPRAV